MKVVAWRISSDRSTVTDVTDNGARVSSLRKYPRAVIEDMVLKSDAEAAIQAARNEAEVMRAAIDAHNAECESMCEQRQQSEDAHCPFAKYDRQCPDCPRDGMLNIAMKGDAHA